MREILAFLACVLIWGTTWYAIEFQVGVVPPAWSVAIRFFLSAVILFVVCASRGIRIGYSWRTHVPALGIGLLLFSLNYVMIYYGTLYLTSGLVAVAFSLLGVFNIINSRLFLKQTLNGVVILAAATGIVGLALIFSEEITSFSFDDDGVLGLAFCVAGTLIASLGNTIAATPQARKLPLLALNAWGMAYGTVANVIFALVHGDPFILADTPVYWVAMMYLSVFGTVIAFTVYLWLINQIGVARAAYVSVVMPIVALLVSTFYEGFEWTTSALIGVGLIIAGNVITVWRRSKPKAAA